MKWARSGVVASVAALLLSVAGAAHAAAPGQVYAFGDNYWGQLGNTTNSATNNPNPTPAAVSLPGATGSIVQVSAGYNHSLALTSTGQLYGFGDNSKGELGSTINNGSSTPNPPTLVALPGATGPVTQMAAAELGTLALTSTGQVYAFGDNFYGNLGFPTNAGNNNPNPNPTQVTFPGATGPITRITAGADHSLAVTSTGQLYAFGRNDYGQLGTTANSNPNPTPALVTLPGQSGPVTGIAGGGVHSLVVTSTGQLYAFGQNSEGQLGRTANNTPNPTPALVALPGASGPVTDVAAGYDHSLARTSTGQLYAFGENRYGQLGNTTNVGTFTANPTPSPVALPGATGSITRFAGGVSHTLVLTASGQLYAFGRNYRGELGSTTNSGTNAANPTPLSIALPAGLLASLVALGPDADHSLVVLIPPVPSLTALRVSPKKFSLTGRRVKGRCVATTKKNRNHKHCKRMISLTITYTLNQAVKVTFTLTGHRPGRKVKGRCVARTKKNRKHKHCIRTVSVPRTVSHQSTAGSNAFTYRRRKALRPGTYTLSATPAGGAAQSVTFTIVK